MPRNNIEKINGITNQKILFRTKVKLKNKISDDNDTVVNNIGKSKLGKKYNATQNKLNRTNIANLFAVMLWIY